MKENEGFLYLIKPDKIAAKFFFKNLDISSFSLKNEIRDNNGKQAVDLAVKIHKKSIL